MNRFLSPPSSDTDFRHSTTSPRGVGARAGPFFYASGFVPRVLPASGRLRPEFRTNVGVMLAKRGDRPIFQLGTPADETRGHQFNLATIRSHRDETVLWMRREILKICQPAKRNAGRGQPFDDGFPWRTAEYDVFQHITIGDTVVIGIKPLVGRDAGIPQHLGAKPYPFAFVLDRDQHGLAVTAALGGVRGDRWVAKSDPLRMLAAVARLQVGQIPSVGERMVE